MLKLLAFALVVCSIAFTNVFSDTSTVKSSSGTEPPYLGGTRAPPQDEVPSAGTQPASQTTKENASPGGTQTHDEASSFTTGPQNKSPTTTQVPDGHNSTVKDEGQSTKDGSNATTVANYSNFPLVPENATTVAAPNGTTPGLQGNGENNQSTTQSLKKTSVANSATVQQTTFTRVVTTGVPVPKPERSFDLVSFIGGLLVALCFILIAVFLYCCSKSGKGKPYESMK